MYIIYAYTTNHRRKAVFIEGLSTLSNGSVGYLASCTASAWSAPCAALLAYIGRPQGINRRIREPCRCRPRRPCTTSRTRCCCCSPGSKGALSVSTNATSMHKSRSQGNLDLVTLIKFVCNVNKGNYKGIELGGR